MPIREELGGFLKAWLRDIPGNTGVRLRSLLFRSGFARGSHPPTTMTNCEFVGAERITFGEGVRIGRGAFFCADGGSIEVGAETSFNTNVHINASVGGTIRIGSQCLVGPNVVMRTADHNFARRDIPILEQGHTVRDILIEEDVWIAANAVILGGARVGRGAVVAAGAVVVSDVEPFAVVGGVPARVIKMRD